MTNSYAAYQKNLVEGADRGTLVLLLYDGLLKFLFEAKKSFEEENYKEGFALLTRADRIVKELIGSLDMEKGGEIAHNLFRLYEFVLWKLLLAEKERKAKHIEEASHIIYELRSAWKEAISKMKEGEKSEKVDRKDKKEKGKVDDAPSISIIG